MNQERNLFVKTFACALCLLFVGLLIFFWVAKELKGGASQEVLVPETPNPLLGEPDGLQVKARLCKPKIISTIGKIEQNGDQVRIKVRLYKDEVAALSSEKEVVLYLPTHSPEPFKAKVVAVRGTKVLFELVDTKLKPTKESSLPVRIELL